MNLGIRTFLLVWFGQAISTFGTAMTRFALLIWAYDQTGQATTLALLGFFSFAVHVVLLPVAGVWVDRLDRKRIMLVADLGAGLITVGFVLLLTAGRLSIWHLYLGEALTGLLEAFQFPAYSASVTLLVPREQLARASGLRSLSVESTNILAPILAGLLLVWIGLRGIMLLDILTMSLAVGMLCVLRIPRPDSSADERQPGSFWQEMTFGTRYIMQRQGLVGLTMVYALIHLFASFTYFSILPAMVLARSGGDELALSGVQSMMGVGGVVGSLIVAIWGGPKHRIHGVLGACTLSFLCGDLLFAMGRTPLVWGVAAFAGAVFIPCIGSSNSAIWQSKVPPELQGRVLGAFWSWGQMLRPVGYLLAGPLADRVFEPAMMPGGALSGALGGLVGTGPGAGIGLMFLLTALFGASSCLAGYLFPALRDVERDLPDFERAAEPGLVLQPAS